MEVLLSLNRCNLNHWCFAVTMKLKNESCYFSKYLFIQFEHLNHHVKKNAESDYLSRIISCTQIWWIVLSSDIILISIKWDASPQNWCGDWQFGSLRRKALALFYYKTPWQVLRSSMSDLDGQANITGKQIPPIGVPSIHPQIDSTHWMVHI